MPVTEASHSDDDLKWNVNRPYSIEKENDSFDSHSVDSDSFPGGCSEYLSENTSLASAELLRHKKLVAVISHDKEEHNTRGKISKKTLNKELSDANLGKNVLDFFDREYSFANRIPRFHTSYLSPNAKYVGEQQSAKGKFKIQVEFQTVDLVNSIVTGFLQITGLTDHHPEIFTCFKGEIINNPLNQFDWQTTPSDTFKDRPIKQFSFLTENQSWGSFSRNDLDHWDKLTSSIMSEPHLKHRLNKIQSGREKNNYVFMRWKEEFLLPDARVKQINGASFEGFYYIILSIGGERDSFNAMAPGSIHGLYYHKSSEKFQSLSLKYVENMGVSSAFNFV